MCTQCTLNLNMYEMDTDEKTKKEYPRFQTTHLVNIKSPGRNSSRAGHIRYLWEEDPTHQTTW